MRGCNIEEFGIGLFINYNEAKRRAYHWKCTLIIVGFFLSPGQQYFNHDEINSGDCHWKYTC